MLIVYPAEQAIKRDLPLLVYKLAEVTGHLLEWSVESSLKDSRGRRELGRRLGSGNGPDHGRSAPARAKTPIYAACRCRHPPEQSATFLAKYLPCSRGLRGREDIRSSACAEAPRRDNGEQTVSTRADRGRCAMSLSAQAADTDKGSPASRGPPVLGPPVINLPKGGGAIRGIGIIAACWSGGAYA